jgi:hypothetical protein
MNALAGLALLPWLLLVFGLASLEYQNSQTYYFIPMLVGYFVVSGIAAWWVDK